MAGVVFEKRRFRRIGCHIRSWVKNKTQASYSGSSGTISDISEGGVRFQSSEPLSMNDEYYLSLDIPGQITVDTYVKPLWSWRGSRRKQCETGACFVSIHPEDRNLIRQLVTSKL